MEADSVERRQEELGIHILENIRNELYYYFPYLDGAFACISGKGSEQTGTIGTDFSGGSGGQTLMEPGL